MASDQETMVLGVDADEKQAPSAARSGCRILLVDDDPVALRQFHETLESLGFEVVASTNDGKHAIELAHLLSPQIALIDWDMPHFGGALTARLLARYAPQVVPVLLLGDDDIAEATETPSDEPLPTVAKTSGPAEMRAQLLQIARRRSATRRLLGAIRGCES
jgi:DNA-binding NarL/FixJ family response regulator